MKKLLTVFGALSVAITILCGASAVTLYNAVESPVIVEEDGWKVIQDNTSDTSTIVANVTTGDPDGDGYIIATNKYDSNDTVAIEKKDFQFGDEVLITFYNDDVVKVSKNN